jgi:predicted alpha/beta-fold hydrolase
MTENKFKPAWWLKNSHMQTIWPVLCRGSIKNLPLERERVELPDGDFIDIDWVGKHEAGPIVVLLHGFEGSIESHYAKGMLQAINLQGWRGAFMYFRGCSGETNRLSRGYHSGETSDTDFVIRTLFYREPETPLAAVGYSLGGNVLLKWLGETGQDNPLKAAVAISVPFELHKALNRIEQGFSKLYQWYLLKCARDRLQRKLQEAAVPIDPALLAEVESVRAFDEKYTVPMHGFSNRDAYYTNSSSRQYLHDIRVPTLILQAKDDPFLTEDAIPTQADVSDSVTLEITEGGGHVGFISGTYPWRPKYWLEERIPAFLRPYITEVP